MHSLPYCTSVATDIGTELGYIYSCSAAGGDCPGVSLTGCPSKQPYNGYKHMYEIWYGISDPTELWLQDLSPSTPPGDANIDSCTPHIVYSDEATCL